MSARPSSGNLDSNTTRPSAHAIDSVVDWHYFLGYLLLVPTHAGSEFKSPSLYTRLGWGASCQLYLRIHSNSLKERNKLLLDHTKYIAICTGLK